MVNRGDSYTYLPLYTSYDLGWLAPILYPLALSLVSIAFALYEGWRAGYTRTATNTLSTTSVLIEAFFAILCFIQCVINYSNRRYVGLDSACDFQAWYACFWVFSSLGLQPIVAHFSYGIAKTQAQPSKSRVIIMVVAVLFIALLVSLFPIMGIGYYGFPKDYCMFELNDSVMGAIFVAYYFVALLTTGAYYIGAVRTLNSLEGTTREETVEPAGSTEPEFSAEEELNKLPTVCGIFSAKRLQIIMFLFFLIIWTPTAIVVLMYQSGGREPPATSSESAWIAISLHSQQLFNPLLVGIVWRRWSAEATRASSLVNRNNSKESLLIQRSSATGMGSVDDSNMPV